MSLASASDRVRDYSAAELRQALVNVLFGDRIGLLAFLGSLCLFGLVWQTAVYITDTYALVNGLYSFSNGQLFLTEAAYGSTLETPGAVRAPDGIIARNYGAIVLALPFWVLLESITLIADLRVTLIGLWSLALLGFVVQLGRFFDRDITVVGGVLVVALFGVNVAIARPLDPTRTHLYALQLVHITVAAFAPVLCYRLLVRIDTRRLAVTATTMLLFGTPLVLWAVIAKRHALTATVVLGIAYTLYRSRTDIDGTLVASGVTFRALAYGLVGLYAWVHAPEALLFLIVLAVVDLPTARDNSPRALAVVGGVFLLSLVPFFLTNLALIGSPIRPPRLFSVAGSGAAEAASGASGSEMPGGADLAGVTAMLPAPLAQLLVLLSELTEPLQLLARELGLGFTVLYTDPAAVWQTLVRSGDAAAALNNSGTQSVNLSLLESAPVLGALAGGLPAAWRRARSGPAITRRIQAETAVDLFAILLCVTLVLQYASRLPIHAQLTVRYLFPLFPLGVYLLARLPVVRATLSTHWRLFAWTTAVTICIGSQLIAVTVFWTTVGLGEAFQLHALLGLATAIPLAAWSCLGRSESRLGRTGAVLVGVATGLATVFVLMVALEYYSIGDSHMLPMVRLVAERVDLF